MPRSEGCSPYAIAVSLLIGIFIGREDAPEQGQVCKASVISGSGIQKVMLGVVIALMLAAAGETAAAEAAAVEYVSPGMPHSRHGRKALTGRLDVVHPVMWSHPVMCVLCGVRVGAFDCSCELLLLLCTYNIHVGFQICNAPS